jgi:very-short-patch-repair endonuclease
MATGLTGWAKADADQRISVSRPRINSRGLSGGRKMEARYCDSMVQAVEPRETRPDPGRILWFYLRNHQLMNMKFRRQARIGGFVAEFLCDEKKLIVEVDSGRRGLHPERNNTKVRQMEVQGFKILRFWDNEVLENIEGVIYAILECGGEL